MKMTLKNTNYNSYSGTVLGFIIIILCCLFILLYACTRTGSVYSITTNYNFTQKFGCLKVICIYNLKGYFIFDIIDYINSIKNNIKYYATTANPTAAGGQTSGSLTSPGGGTPNKNPDKGKKDPNQDDKSEGEDLPDESVYEDSFLEMYLNTTPFTGPFVKKRMAMYKDHPIKFGFYTSLVIYGVIMYILIHFEEPPVIEWDPITATYTIYPFRVKDADRK